MIKYMIKWSCRASTQTQHTQWFHLYMGSMGSQGCWVLAMPQDCVEGFHNYQDWRVAMMAWMGQNEKNHQRWMIFDEC